MNGLKKTLSIMLCVAMIASGSFMAFAEGESNPQNVTVVEAKMPVKTLAAKKAATRATKAKTSTKIKKKTKMRINSSPRRFWQQSAR